MPSTSASAPMSLAGPRHGRAALRVGESVACGGTPLHAEWQPPGDIPPPPRPTEVPDLPAEQPPPRPEEVPEPEPDELPAPESRSTGSRPGDVGSL